MPQPDANSPPVPWAVVPDSNGRFSSGIPDLDRLLGGGYERGRFALFETDGSLVPEDWLVLFAPTMLNFLSQSRGVMAVLPSLESPHHFRTQLLHWVSRRRFDSRVRVVEYAGEDDERPYVVSLAKSLRRPLAMRLMAQAERAVQGARKRPFLEFNAMEVLETVVGPDQAARMFFFGTKRTRAVGNLGIALLRPGLRCADAARSLMDYDFAVRREEVGLLVTGRRPRFSTHLVVPDVRQGRPCWGLVPSP